VKRSELFFGLLRIPVDFVAAYLALLAAYSLRAQDILPEFFKKPDLEVFPTFPEYIRLAIFGAILFVIILSFFGLYSLRVTDRPAREMRKLLYASLIWLMAAVSYYFLIRDFPFSRLALIYSMHLLFVFAAIGRALVGWLQRAALKKGIGKRRIVIFGKNKIEKEVAKVLTQSGTVTIVATINSLEELQALIKKGELDEIIQTKDSRDAAEEIIALCRSHHIQYHFVPDLLEVHRSNIEIFPIAGIPLISLRPTSLDGWGTVWKRGFDIVGAILGIILLSPFLLIIAIAIKLDSKGPVLFRYLDDGKTKALRVGEHGRTFQCFKFRTMQTGTHHKRYTELAEKNLRKGTPLVKIKDDPRVTRVGKFLRRFSLDELPQLWNVLRGEMSLVGPRPHLPEEVAKYDRKHLFVHTIKPGITGLAQISGRSDLPFEEEVRLDTYYIENWSLLSDMKIVLKTIGVVLRPYGE